MLCTCSALGLKCLCRVGNYFNFFFFCEGKRYVRSQIEQCDEDKRKLKFVRVDLAVYIIILCCLYTKKVSRQLRSVVCGAVGNYSESRLGTPHISTCMYS